MGMAFTPSMRSFRFYEDGTESGSVAAAAQDTNLSRNVISNSNILLRVRLQETTGGSPTVSPMTYQLQYSKNSGTWTDVTTSSTNVKAFNSSNLTDLASTTNRLGAGTGSFVAGAVSEAGTYDDVSPSASNYNEDLFALTLLSANLANSDTLDFRVKYNGSVMTDTVTPRVTVVNGNTYNETGSAGAAIGSTAIDYKFSSVVGTKNKYATLTTFTNVINGAAIAPTLKNLSNGSRKLGNLIDNITNSSFRFPYSNWELKCRFQSTPGVNKCVDLYFIKAANGTIYETGDDSTAPGYSAYVGSFMVQNSTSAQRICIRGIFMPNCKFKPMIVNRAGQAFTNTDGENILSYETYTFEF